MGLSPGTKIGHYNVTSLLGEGGMGQVWQATDTQLNRQVALKILPDAFASDPDRLARFKREAQILASLNHPNIAAIYGIEEAEGTRALVLELVEGPTLADRISQGPIPLDEALPSGFHNARVRARIWGVLYRSGEIFPERLTITQSGTDTSFTFLESDNFVISGTIDAGGQIQLLRHFEEGSIIADVSFVGQVDPGGQRINGTLETTGTGFESGGCRETLALSAVRS